MYECFLFCQCCSSSWMPQGVYLESNRDECTVSLVYAVHLEKKGAVSFTYQYPDNNIFFEFYVSTCFHSLWKSISQNIKLFFGILSYILAHSIL